MSKPAYKRARANGGEPMNVDTRYMADELARLRNEINRNKKEETELKGYDVAIASFPGTIETALNTNTDTLPLNLIRQGTNFNNRLGKEVKLHSLRLRGVVQGHDVVGSGHFARIVIVLCKKKLAAIPNFNDIFGGFNEAASTFDSILGGVKLEKTKEYKVLMDKVVALGPASPNAHTAPTALSTPAEYIDQFLIFKKPIKVSFNEVASPAVTDLQENALILYARSKSGVVYFYDVFCRVRFTE